MNTTTFQNIKKSIIAVSAGFLLTLLVLFFLKADVKNIAYAMVVKPYITPFLFSKALIMSLVLVVVSLSMAVALNGKLFNLGIPGQMLAGAIVSTLLAIRVFPDGLKHGWILLVIAGAIAGGLYGCLAGWLRARFQIHEVVGTIMLNWVIFYLGKQIFSLPGYKDGGFPGSKFWHQSLEPPVYFMIIAVVAITLLVWFIFNKTTLGYKIEMVGKQPKVADYAGISKFKTQILTMTISGVLAGIAGVFFYGKYTGQYTIPLFDGLDSIGFDSMIIALVSFSNPFSIVVISFIFGFLRIGGYAAAVFFAYSTQLMALNMGITMYIIAASENIGKFKKTRKKGN